MKMRFNSFAFEKTSRVSLTCKLVLVLYREYEYGALLYKAIKSYIRSKSVENSSVHSIKCRYGEPCQSLWTQASFQNSVFISACSLRSRGCKEDSLKVCKCELYLGLKPKYRFEFLIGYKRWMIEGSCWFSCNVFCWEKVWLRAQEILRWWCQACLAWSAYSSDWLILTT